MLKLLIAEDEALERKALRFLINKYYGDIIQIAEEVTNGRDAVEKAVSRKPDIILMDIHMPIMDGLEACSAIRDHNRNTEIIILTAFNYFDYAKKAIKIGVSDYLLKPFSNDEFTGAINSVIEKIRSKEEKEARNKELRENYKRIIPYIEKQMAANIAYGVTLSDEQFQEYRDILNIKAFKFCCILFNIADKKYFDEESLFTIKSKLKIIFSNIVGGLCLNDIILFVFDEEVENKVLSKGFENILNSISDEFKSSKGTNISVGIGNTNEGFSRLYLSYKEAKRDLKAKGKSEDGPSCSTNRDMPGVSSNNLDLNEISHTLCGRVINEDLKGAMIELDAILEFLFNNEEGYELSKLKKDLLDTFSSIIDNIQEFIGSDFKNFNKEKMLEELLVLEEFSDLRNCTGMLLKSLMNHISSYKRSKNIDLVEKVKKYIESNYMRDLSLDELAQYVSMSSFYLSRVFAKVENINLKEYLIKVRMEKAKSLLREGKKSIKQISMEVGYIDQNYFSKAFKKYTNLSPKEYSNL